MSSPAPLPLDVRDRQRERDRESDIREYEQRIYGHQQHRHHQSDIKPDIASPSPTHSSRSSPRPYPRSMPASAPTFAHGAGGSSSGSGSGETMTGAGGAAAPYPPAHQHSHRPSSMRSPSGSSLSSHRSHPYNRRTSGSIQSGDRDSARDLPRIHLPYPGSSIPGGPNTPSTGSVPPLSSLALDPPRERASLPRAHSGGGGGGGALSRGLNLPPLHSISGNSPPGHHQPPYPYDRSPSDGYPRTHSPQPPHSQHDRAAPGRSNRDSPGPYPLRPSYTSTYDPYPTPHHTSPIDHEPSSRHYPPPPPEHYGHPGSAHHHHTALPPPSAHHRGARDSTSSYRRVSPHDYPEPPSPPLRAVQHDYHPHSAHPSSHSHRSSTTAHHPYHQPHSGYFPPPEGYPHSHGHGGHPIARSRSHSTSRMVEEPTSGPGQNRRIAHLMSEQKRRESINSGFQSLRNALPGALPTDSKAIILRKAVSHIKHIESVLHKAGVSLNAGGTSSGGSGAGGQAGGPALTPSSWDEDGDEERGDVDMEEHQPSYPKAKWEDERRAGDSGRGRGSRG